MDEFSMIFDLIEGLGQWAVFFYLFIIERKKSEAITKAHIDDLRDIVGLNKGLQMQSGISKN